MESSGRAAVAGYNLLLGNITCEFRLPVPFKPASFGFQPVVENIILARQTWIFNQGKLM
jgi:hypothetical protein